VSAKTVAKLVRTKEAGGAWKTSVEAGATGEIGPEGPSGPAGPTGDTGVAHGNAWGPLEIRHDTPGLNDGVVAFVPDEGDLLLFALAENPESFDGLSSNYSFGQGVPVGGQSQSYSFNGPTDPVGGMTVVENELRQEHYVLTGEPMEVWVSTDDTKGGPPCDATTGLLRLWFVVVGTQPWV
jgi:hypothetical protein